MARALALETKILPAANFDPRNTSIIEEIITDINRELEMTIVMTTHNMFQLKNLPHRVVLSANGKTSDVGTPRETFEKLSETLLSFAVVDNTFTGDADLRRTGQLWWILSRVSR